MSFGRPAYHHGHPIQPSPGHPESAPLQRVVAVHVSREAVHRADLEVGVGPGIITLGNGEIDPVFLGHVVVDSSKVFFLTDSDSGSYRRNY